MKRLCPQRFAPKHSLVAFVVAVALALVASLTQLLPDITAQSADAMSNLPDGLGWAMPDAGTK